MLIQIYILCTSDITLEHEPRSNYLIMSSSCLECEMLKQNNLNNISEEFKIHIKNRFILRNPVDGEQGDLLIETRDIIRKESKRQFL